MLMMSPAANDTVCVVLLHVRLPNGILHDSAVSSPFCIMVMVRAGTKLGGGSALCVRVTDRCETVPLIGNVLLPFVGSLLMLTEPATLPNRHVLLVQGQGMNPHVKGSAGKTWVPLLSPLPNGGIVPQQYAQFAPSRAGLWPILLLVREKNGPIGALLRSTMSPCS
jgi:hypothetical protein